MRSRAARLSRCFRRVPRTAWIAAVVVTCATWSWAFITPPFQVGDENAHFAYVQYMFEEQRLPKGLPPPGGLAPEEHETLVALGFYGLIGRPGSLAAIEDFDDQRLDRVEDRDLSRVGSGDVLSATNNPPAYYAYLAPYYAIGRQTGVADRLMIMRLGSGMLAGLATLFIFGFIRELLPREPGAWVVGSIVAGLQPMFGFMSGGINNDIALTTCASALMFCLARIVKRGLTGRRAGYAGLALGLGLLSKLTMLAFVPVAIVALVVALRRGVSRASWRAVGIGVAMAGALPLLYVFVSLAVFDRSLFGVNAGSGGGGGSGESNFREMLSYTWQLLLPKLWFMESQFSYTPLTETWFKGLVGHFGWLDTPFSVRTHDIAQIIFFVMTGLLVISIGQHRAAVARNWPAMLVCSSAVVGLWLLVGQAGYSYRVSNGTQFEQARYALPLLPIYGLTVAVASRVGTARTSALVSGAMIGIAVSHLLLAQLLVTQRYYV